MKPKGRDLGRLGEDVLKQWAHHSGIVLNPVQHDASGWDFLLEWPLPGGGGPNPTTLDHRPPPYQVLVQVKATDGDPRSWPIKLDNWLRLMATPLPAFFLLMYFDGSESCHRARLAHVSKEYISHVLKRLRELSASGGEDALHTRRLSLRASDGVKLQRANAASFEKSVRSLVGTDISAYMSEKLRLRETLGYEDTTAAIRFNFKVPESSDPSKGAQDLLVDLALGLIKDIEIEGGEYTDVRFGIPAPTPDRIFPKGSRFGLGDQSPIGGGRLIFEDATGRREIIPVDMHMPTGVAQAVEKANLRIRFAGPFFDFVWGPWGGAKCTFHLRPPPDDERTPLLRYRPAATIIRLLGEAAADVAFNLEVEINGNTVSNGSLTGFPALPAPFRDWAGAVGAASAVAAHFGIEHDVEVSPAELLHARDVLLLLQGLLAQDGREFSAQFHLDTAPEDDSAPWCVPGVTELRMGRYFIQLAWGLFGAGGLTGEADETGPWYGLVTSDARVLGKHLCGEKERPPMTAKETLDQLVARFDADHSVFLIT